MAAILMTQDNRSKPGVYGERKKQKCFLITDLASKEMDKIANELGLTRSDLLERAIRAGGLKLAEGFKLESENFNNPITA